MSHSNFQAFTPAFEFEASSLCHPRPHFRLFSSFQTNIIILKQINRKNGIQTHNLQYMSLLPSVTRKNRQSL